MKESSTVETLLLWAFSLASLAGAVWLWLNLDMDDMLLAKVIVVGVLWLAWTGIVAVAIGAVALFLGMLGVVVKPFRR